MATEREWALYNCIDSAATFKVWNEIADEIDTSGYRGPYDRTIALYPCLEYMMVRGIKLDSQALKDTQVEVGRNIEEKREQLRDEVGFDLNANSSKQCQAYFYGVLGVKPYLSTTTHKPTTDDKAMARLSRKGFREARTIQDIRGLIKLKSTYLDIELEADGRMRCSYNPRGTVSGRLSSSKSVMMTGTNMQNLPAQFKRFLIADEGCLFFDLDKRQAEWVITAYAAGDALMIQIVESGEDPHLATAQLITGCSRKDIIDEHKALGSSTDQDYLERMRAEMGLCGSAKFLPRSMTCRQAGKKTNHGLNYDMGYRRFALENEIPEVDAKRLHAKYHDAYIGLRVWYEQVQKQLSKTRTLTNCFGTKRRFLNAWNDELFRAAYDFIPQSTTAEIVNGFMIEAYNIDDKDFKQAEVLAQVHDNALTQIHNVGKGQWKRVARTLLEMKRMMEPKLCYSRREFVVETDLKMGLNWGTYDRERNPKGMMELDFSGTINELAGLLEHNYATLIN